MITKPFDLPHFAGAPSGFECGLADAAKEGNPAGFFCVKAGANETDERGIFTFSTTSSHSTDVEPSHQNQATTAASASSSDNSEDAEELLDTGDGDDLREEPQSKKNGAGAAGSVVVPLSLPRPELDQADTPVAHSRLFVIILPESDADGEIGGARKLLRDDSYGGRAVRRSSLIRKIRSRDNLQASYLHRELAALD